MEKKVNVFKNGLQLVLVVLLVSSCRGMSQPENSPPKTTDQTATEQTADNSELNQTALPSFKSSVTTLYGELTQLGEDLKDSNKQDISTADVNKIIQDYKALGNTNELLEDSDRAVLKALEAMEEIKGTETSPEVGDLQNALVKANLLTAQGDPTYGEITNESLINYLKQIEDKVDNFKSDTRSTANPDLTSPSGKTDGTTQKQTRKTMPFEIIDLIILALFGGLTFWIWKLGQKIVDLNDTQSNLNSGLKAINQNLKTKESQDFSLKNDVYSLMQKLEIQEKNLNAFAQDLRQSNTPNLQNLTSQQTIREAQPMQDLRSSQRPQAQAPQYHQAPPQNKIPTYLRLVKQYNQSPNSLASYAAGVSQTEESLKQNLQDSSQTSVVLAQDNSPNYWIIRDELDNYWLFPKEGWEPSIGTLESFVKLFNITGNPSRNYQVIKPASVIQMGQSDWSLKEVGEIEFS